MAFVLIARGPENTDADGVPLGTTPVIVTIDGSRAFQLQHAVQAVTTDGAVVAGLEAFAPPASEQRLAWIDKANNGTQAEAVAPEDWVLTEPAGNDLPRASVRAHLNDATQSVLNGVWTTVTFNAETYDTDTMHDNVTNNERITFTSAGKYHITLRVRWDVEKTGNRFARILLNGTVELGLSIDPAVASVGLGTSTQLDIDKNFIAGDFVTTEVKQDSGGTRTILGGTGLATAIAAFCMDA